MIAATSRWGRARLIVALVLAAALGGLHGVPTLAYAGKAEGADRPGPHHRYAVARSATPGLADHTLLRPARLDKVRFKMPVVAWGNGGCRSSNMEFNYFLTRFASYGYFIVANGAPGNPYDPNEVTGMVKPAPEKLIAGITWATKQNDSPSSPYYKRLDTRRVAVMGQSCGGYEALRASADDRRVRSTIVWNSGSDPQDPAAVTRLHAPVLYADGGSTDVMHGDATASFQVTAVPSVFASLAGAGHTAMWDDPPPPQRPPGAYQDEPLLVAQQWLSLTLYGMSSAERFFLGASCGLCRRPGWTVQSKNWPE